MADFLIAAGGSWHKPLDGQDHRSGNNFSVSRKNGSCSKVKLVVIGNTNAANIIFDVKQDKSMATDPVIYDNKKSGDIVDYKDLDYLYIADPRNANSSSFVVQFFKYS